MGDDSALSQHPADRLIREIVQSRRAVTSAETEQIIDRIVTAPFNPEPLHVRVHERGVTYEGRTLTARTPSLAYHVVKRVAIEGQWAPGLTETQFLEDIRRAVRDDEARLTVYERRRGILAATVTPTARIVAPERLGPDPQPSLLVICSADRGIIVTAYQFSTLDQTSVPEDARWLK